ncbi:flagellar biosynthetic protein FliO [Alteromonas aestuariivivens]|uniref:Flagellar protein n=1 Tax=Alteromonas aestuariivivens TaxID=1938339 RepID=A0A3D8M5P9_9ALTE|nr:flagellar biosynthetic protein FliO [Alteromonas aestuariivivens]RDV25077.1 flagellar biosynthetic protein FliO [Alteromonas aestuariivivens]
MSPLFLSPQAFADNTQSITNPGSVVSIFLSLLLVVAIIFSLAWLMRRFNVAHSSSGQMKVVSSMIAGAKERILVIEVGQEQHLIGVTSHTITHLSKLETPLSSDSRKENGAEHFKQKLIQAMAGKMNPAVKGAGHDKD